MNLENWILLTLVQVAKTTGNYEPFVAFPGQTVTLVIDKKLRHDRFSRILVDQGLVLDMLNSLNVEQQSYQISQQSGGLKRE